MCDVCLTQCVNREQVIFRRVHREQLGTRFTSAPLSLTKYFLVRVNTCQAHGLKCCMCERETVGRFWWWFSGHFIMCLMILSDDGIVIKSGFRISRRGSSLEKLCSNIMNMLIGVLQFPQQFSTSSLICPLMPCLPSRDRFCPRLVYFQSHSRRWILV